MMLELFRDFRYAARSLARSRGFTLTSILTLALGIGPTTALWSLENAMHLLQFPFREPERVVAVRETFQGRISAVSYPNFQDFRAGTSSFEGMAAFRTFGAVVSGRGAPFFVLGGIVTTDFFSVIGVRPVLGRAFLPDETGAKVVLIDHNFWQQRLGGEPNVLGSLLMLNREPHIVIGILPPGFFFFGNVLWVPAPAPSQAGARGERNWTVLARLMRGVELEAARAEIQSVAARLAREFPETNTGYGGGIGYFRDEHTSYGPGTLLPLLAAVGFLLLIACLNVASLLVARGMTREVEIAVRAALGASRSQIARLLVCEIVIMGVLGGGGGLLLAAGLVPALVQLIPENMARAGFPQGLESIRLDWNVLMFSAGLSLLAIFVFGLAPAAAAARPDLEAVLRKGSGRATGRIRVYELLAVTEIAFGLILLTGAVLMLESLLRLDNADRGIAWERMVQIGIPFVPDQYRDPPRKAEFTNQLLRRVEQIPGVECSATSAFRLNRRHSIDAADVEARIDTWVVSPLYFRATALPILRGRGFTESDRQGSTPVAIINQALARRFFRDRDPIGRRLRPLDEPNAPWLTIIGVAGDMLWMRNPTRPFDIAPQPAVYLAYAQNPASLSSLIVRTEGNPRAAAPAIEQAVRSLVPDAPIQATAGAANFARELERPRLNAFVSGAFALVGLLLSAVGIYGVLSQAAARRTREVGIRMAVGARPGDILRLVAGRAVKLALAGAVLGTAGSLALGTVIESQLYGARPAEPVRLVVAALVLGLIALMAAYLPARRAARLDPVAALRHE